MIFCKDKIFGKVWKVEKKEKYLDLQMSTSEKDKDGNYINSPWYPRVIGHAFNTLKDDLAEGDKIIITKSKFTNERYTAKDGTVKYAFRFIILEAEKETSDEAAAVKPAEPVAETTAGSDDDCPW